MFSTTEICTDKMLLTPNQYYPTKNPSAQKSLNQFLEGLDVKHKTAACRLGAAKKIRSGNDLW